MSLRSQNKTRPGTRTRPSSLTSSQKKRDTEFLAIMGNPIAPKNSLPYSSVASKASSASRSVGSRVPTPEDSCLFKNCKKQPQLEIIFEEVPEEIANALSDPNIKPPSDKEVEKLLKNKNALTLIEGIYGKACEFALKSSNSVSNRATIKYPVLKLQLNPNQDKQRRWIPGGEYEDEKIGGWPFNNNKKGEKVERHVLTKKQYEEFRNTHCFIRFIMYLGVTVGIGAGIAGQIGFPMGVVVMSTVVPFFTYGAAIGLSCGLFKLHLHHKFNKIYQNDLGVVVFDAIRERYLDNVFVITKIKTDEDIEIEKEHENEEKEKDQKYINYLKELDTLHMDIITKIDENLETREDYITKNIQYIRDSVSFNKESDLKEILIEETIIKEDEIKEDEIKEDEIIAKDNKLLDGQNDEIKTRLKNQQLYFCKNNNGYSLVPSARTKNKAVRFSVYLDDIPEFFRSRNISTIKRFLEAATITVNEALTNKNKSFNDKNGILILIYICNDIKRLLYNLLGLKLIGETYIERTYEDDFNNKSTFMKIISQKEITNENGFFYNNIEDEVK